MEDNGKLTKQRRGRRLWIILTILAAILLLPPFIATFFGESVTRAVVKTLNERFLTTITVEEYDIYFWSSFPSLSVGLRNVHVEGSDGSDLLQAEAVDFLLPVNSLLSKIRVEHVDISEGELYLRKDQDGNVNYLLSNYTSVGEQNNAVIDTDKPTEFAISEATLRDMNVVYRDEQLDVDLVSRVEKLEFTGDFGAQQYVLSTDGTILVEYLDQQGDRYAFRQRLHIAAETAIDHASGIYTLSPLSIEAGDLNLTARGTIQPNDQGLSTDLRLESKSGKLEDLIQLIPPAYASALNELETYGDLELAATVTGDWTEHYFPRIEGLLNFSDGHISSPRTNLGAEDLNLQAIFTYLEGPRGGIQIFEVRQFTGAFRGEEFQGQLLIEDIAEPHITLSANGAFALQALPAFLGDGPISDADGFLRLHDVHVSGLYEDMTRPRGMDKVTAEGSIVADDASIELGGETWAFDSGTLQVRGNNLALNRLHVKGPGTQLQFSGTATNLIPVLFADSLNTNDSELLFKADLTGDRLDLEAALRALGDEQKNDTALPLPQQSTRVRATDLLRGTFSAKINSWKYEQIEGEAFDGTIAFSPGALDINGFTNAMGGGFSVMGSVDLGEHLKMEGRMAGRGVDVREFFEQGENFGQEVLTADNLRGDMDTRIWVEAAFDSTGTLEYDSLRVLADIAIEDGELRDFGLLEDFVFALKKGDLDRVRFTRLENFFEISNRRIYFPGMKIQSSALNLKIAGEHSFDQDIAYFVKVNAGQAIVNKLSHHDDELEILPDRRGWFNLYYSMKGPLEDFEIERDKRGVKRAFERGTARREVIRAELNRHFVDETIQMDDFLRKVGWE